ncbi:MAG: hypothetical protein B6I28_02110 [Fusobacteriia bacterium 4572_132]|nr:MAG: hypothetical protein B6I28_02110 [Fusobacteriia bacterium 4572_132]
MRNLDKNMDLLNKMMIEMIKSVERSLEITMELLEKDTFNKGLYGEGKYLEEEINDYELKIGEKAVETIAMYQPTAFDLRYIIGLIRMSITVERIGDLCINTLKTIKREFKDAKNLEKELVSITEMGEKVMEMYKIFITGYIEGEYKKGYILLGLDDEIDRMKYENIKKIKEKIKENVECLELGIENLLISKNYERIADNITNLGESLVYIYRGKDLRHKSFEEIEKYEKDIDS